MPQTFGQPQETVVDLVVKANDEVMNLNGIPAQADVADSFSNGETLVVSTSREAINAELVNEKHLYISLLSELETKENTLIEKHTALADVIRNNQQVLDDQTARDAFTLKSYRPKVAYNGKWQGVMIVPVSNYTVTSPWGDRVHPIYGNVRHHAGIDLGVDYGAPVRAAADGVVTLSAWYGGYGKAVMLDHGNAISTLYGHNSQILVKDGQVVRQGEIIALAGSTGNSTGPHCHFEVRNNGEDIDPITFVAGGF